MSKKLLRIYPFLLAIFPAIFLFSHNIGELRYNVVWLPVIIVLIISIGVYFFIKLFIKDDMKAGFILAILLIAGFYYGLVYDFIKDWHVSSFYLGRHRYLMPATVLIVSFVSYLILHTKRNLIPFVKILAFSSIVLFITPLFTIVTHEFNNTGGSSGNNEYQAQDDSVDKSLPDIYYIIPDMYAGSGVLKEYFDYSNDEFTDYLKEKGFIIPSMSQSNYTITWLSLASTLNLGYAESYMDKEEIESNSSSYGPILKALENNEVVKFLKSNGYKFVRFRYAYSIAGADVEVGNITLNEFPFVLIDSTILRSFKGRDRLIEKFLTGGIRNRILGVFDELEDVPEITGPKFVLVHIASPHWPYLFGPNGEKVAKKFASVEEVDPEEEMSLYLDQLIFINKKLSESIDAIISKSDKPPVIVIQSDHGFDIPIDASEDVKSVIAVQNFSALYLPDKDPNIVPEFMTPVNTFRLIFDSYFGTNFGLLENKSFRYIKDSPYEFVEVGPLK